jgi:flagellar biosynthesis GTPase FlhF
LETKRFIGNDMPRIYDRVRREFGPDAVIVRTRSLLREGADPLIEVLAAPPEAEYELSLEMQRVLIGGALARVESSRELTVGDLEDLVARESALDTAYGAPSAVAPLDAPWPLPAPAPAPVNEPEYDPVQAIIDELRGAPRDEQSAEPAPDPARRFPRLPDVPAEAPPANDWASRPRPAIITRRRPSQPDEPAARMAPPPAPARASHALHAELTAAGLSQRAADAILLHAVPGASAHDALRAVLESRAVRYPAEGHTALISIQGGAGSGRTTALMRMALDCADAGRRAVLLAADGGHVAGREQVRAYGEAIGIEVIDIFDPGDIVRSVGHALRGACLFVDAPAGPWQAPPIPGVDHFGYVAIPAHWQGHVAAAAIDALPSETMAGAVLTFSDIATTLSPAVSLVVESGLGLAFLSSGRDVGTGIDVADPATLASGIFTTFTRESTDGRLVATA